jgi:alpha-ketoglutarate-dependent taurine dioxygenase
LREAYRAETVRFEWKAGDLLMLDNMLTSHGRDPFDPPRRIVVGMADPLKWENVEDRGGNG